MAVENPAPYSVMSYNAVGSIYLQNFNGLPDPGTTSVNNGTGQEVTIDGTNYYTSNPFDFAAPLQVPGDVDSKGNPEGGLNISSMQGWYSSDLGAEQIQATSGNTTTGLIVSEGCLNTRPQDPLGIYSTNNRALGILSSPATSFDTITSDGIFALRVRNLTGHILTNINMSYVSELWRDTAVSNIVTNWFYVDPLGSSTTPTNNWTGGFTNLSFNSNAAPGFSSKNSKIYGTNMPLLQTNMSFVNLQIPGGCPQGGLIWLVWEEQFPVSGGQGIAIDNFVFSSGPPAIQSNTYDPVGNNAIVSWPQMFLPATLQYNTSASSTGWHNVTGGTLSTNYDGPLAGCVSLTIPAGATQQYYRLDYNGTW
jgi:hypothetical protein